MHLTPLPAGPGYVTKQLGLGKHTSPKHGRSSGQTELLKIPYGLKGSQTGRNAENKTQEFDNFEMGANLYNSGKISLRNGKRGS